MKVIALLLATAAAALAQSSPRFTITKSTIDGGGAGSAAVSRFALTGTTGQADAAPVPASAGGRFNLQPGFWGQVTLVQIPGAPELTMRPSRLPGYAILAWPVSVTGYVLQQSPDMTAVAWTSVTIRVVDNATEHTVLMPLTASRQFFRLVISRDDRQ